MRRSQYRRAMRAFTLIELLITIAVVSLLVGLLAPSLARISSASRSTACQSNLRQMATAAQSYAVVFDAFPAAIRYEQVDGVLHHVGWDYVTAFPSQFVALGPLWTYTENPGEAMQCPDCAAAPTDGEPCTGYNYNTSHIGGEAAFGQVGWSSVRRGVPPHACNRSSMCAMFGDGGRKSGANRFMRAPMNSEGLGLATIYSGGQAFRHAGSTNIAFVDGHVGSTNAARPGSLATPVLLQQFMGFPANGFLSNDDSAYDPR